MVENPLQLPIEEQVRQDSRFSRLLEISPEFVEPLAAVVTESEKEEFGSYSSFWLGYTEGYNRLVGAVTIEVGNKGKKQLEKFEKRRLALISRLMILTHNPTTFESESGQRLVGCVNAILKDNGDISEWEVLFSDILIEVTDLLPR